jgi:hypothetical protein
MEAAYYYAGLKYYTGRTIQEDGMYNNPGWKKSEL